ncbi:MAG: chemotaxis protein CheR [Desulfuromonas sp.]|nr:MAG: chemotaxis protein CheR [Desulfuromonas sp.]
MKRTLWQDSLTQDEFNKVASLVHGRAGIKMPVQKKSMLEARLRKRIRSLDLDSFTGYVEFLFEKEGLDHELVHLLDVVSTNKTDFFRESAHFDFLKNQAFPALLEQHGVGVTRPLKAWSAGCSTGEEPYTLAMTLLESSLEIPDYKFKILGTDLSTIVLQKAVQAIYPESKTTIIPPEIKKKYLLRSKDRDSGLIRMAPIVRQNVTFSRLNFMDEDFGLDDTFHLIFCRNVIIYFDQGTQRRLLSRLLDHLKPNGYLFMGHSETLHGLGLPIRQLAPSVYQLRDMN